MASPPENQYIEDLSTSYGPMLAGAAFACALWGISCMQLFIYASNRSSDPLSLKLLVYALWICDTVAEGLTLAGFWPTLILRWGSLEELGGIRTSTLHRLWAVCIVSFVVHAFYCYRIYRLAGKRWRWLGLILVPCMIWELVTPVLYITWSLENLTYATLLTTRMKVVATALRATSAVIDLVVMVAMMNILLRMQHSEFRRTRKMLDRLVIITVNTGLWTAILAIIDLILAVVYHDGIQYCLVEFPLSSLYLNAFLANLNTREYIRGEHENYNSFELGSGSGGNGLPPSNGLNFASTQHLQPVTVRVATDTAVHMDSIDSEKLGKGQL